MNEADHNPQTIKERLERDPIEPLTQISEPGYSSSSYIFPCILFCIIICYFRFLSIQPRYSSFLLLVVFNTSRFHPTFYSTRYRFFLSTILSTFSHTLTMRRISTLQSSLCDSFYRQCFRFYRLFTVEPSLKKL